MGTIDPMYQFALDAYTDLYSLSIDKSQRSPKLEERINNLNEYHTYAVYRYMCCKGKLVIYLQFLHSPIYEKLHQSQPKLFTFDVLVSIRGLRLKKLAQFFFQFLPRS